MSQNFKNAKIYKITNNCNNEIYIGSTCDSLSKRFSSHKCAAIEGKNQNRPFYKLINELGIECFRIDLIEEWEANDKQEIRQIEGKYIKEMGTLNKNIAGQTLSESQKMYYKNNSDKIKSYVKLYNEENEENIKKYNKQYKMENKESITEYQKQYDKKYQEKMKDTIKEKRSVIVTCKCGCTVQKSELPRHQKTKKHLSFDDNNKI